MPAVEKQWSCPLIEEYRGHIVRYTVRPDAVISTSAPTMWAWRTCWGILINNISFKIKDRPACGCFLSPICDPHSNFMPTSQSFLTTSWFLLSIDPFIPPPPLALTYHSPPISPPSPPFLSIPLFPLQFHHPFSIFNPPTCTSAHLSFLSSSLHRYSFGLW